METLWFAPNNWNTFSNSPPESTSTDMLPLCLAGRMVQGTFTAVSTEARMYGIDIGTRYTIMFSKGRYRLRAGDWQDAGAYAWGRTVNARDSSGGIEQSRETTLMLYPRTGGERGSTWIASDQGSGTWSSPLGYATFEFVARKSM